MPPVGKFYLAQIRQLDHIIWKSAAPTDHQGQLFNQPPRKHVKNTNPVMN